MSIHQRIETAPQILTLFRGMDDYNRHRVLQLLLREFACAEDEGDLFLAAAASELHPNSESAQDDLYPIGGLTAQASRDHRIELERRILQAERYAAGHAAMLCARMDRIASARNPLPSDNGAA